jgi:hypothetical protein
MDTLKAASLAFILCIGPCYAADKIRLVFIRKASWIDLRDRSTFFIGNSTTQKTIICSASERSRSTVPRYDGSHNIR